MAKKAPKSQKATAPYKKSVKLIKTGETMVSDDGLIEEAWSDRENNKKWISTGKTLLQLHNSVTQRQLPPGTIKIGDTLFNPGNSEAKLRSVLHEFEITYARQSLPLNRYVIVFAHSHLYKDSPRHVLVVTKGPGTMHEGLFNLPGGKVELKEKPAVAALRELREECGVEGSQTQLAGAILPSGADGIGDSFIVYVYRCLINPGQEVKSPDDQPASWQLIEDCRSGKWLPGLSVILPLLAANVIGFVVQDTWWEPQKSELPENLAPVNSQSLVTFLRHSISDAANEEHKKQRFTT